MEKKYIVCFSGGHSSALAAIETVRKYGRENVILLNHDISEEVEDKDIKRFKREVADYLGINITYANMPQWEKKTPLRVCRELGGFKFGNGYALCTAKLKTEPFYKWLSENFPVAKGEVREDVVIIYGFDRNETDRIQRRIGVMISKGYKCDFPLAFYEERTIYTTETIGIKLPSAYLTFRHGNCKACLKSGRQSWYIVYCLYPELWKEAIDTENEIGFSILNDCYLIDLEPKFAKMKCSGIIPSENLNPQTFWSMVEKSLPIDGQVSLFPCECSY